MTHTVEMIALVTGANRGIGYAVCQQLAERGIHIILTSRDEQKGQQAVRQLQQRGYTVAYHQLDVTDPQSITLLCDSVQHDYGRLDILVNNAAIHYDNWQRAINADLGIVQEALQTNLYGAWRMCQAFIPLMRMYNYGRIVNVSSGAGALNDMGGGTPAYSVSKAALNALTRMLAAEVRGSGILVNSVCPGWVATDMGGAGGRPVAEGAAGIVWAATLPAGGATGGFFRDGRPIEW